MSRETAYFYWYFLFLNLKPFYLRGIYKIIKVTQNKDN